VSRDELDKRQPSELAQALSITPDAPEKLSDEELGAVLRHLLESPLSIDLMAGQHGSANIGDSVSFGQLLADDRPSADLLQRVQRFAKACKTNADGPLPQEVASVLYFAAIIKSMVALNQRTSALGDTALVTGVRWSLERSWLTTSLRKLLESGMQQLESGQ
jgi:hypothetical protein